MPSEWNDFVAKVKASNRCSFKEALVIASKLWKKGIRDVPPKGGAVWKLTPEQQRQYKEDKANNRNMVNKGSYTVWEPPT